MNHDDQLEIVRALLERLRADASLPQPRFTAVVSGLERTAIESLLGKNNRVQNLEPLEHLQSGEVLEPKEVPIEQPIVRPPQRVLINTDCLTATFDTKYVVCIDFGTARSKAFAAEIAEEGDDEDTMLHFDLGLGKRDGDLEVYSVASSVWISDDGLMFAGSEAMRRSAQSHDRMRLDSIKQELSQTSSSADIRRPLPADINPTQVKLTYAEAICFYLSFLTDLIGRELDETHGLSRYTRRRFTIPAWKDDQRQWAHKELKTLIKQAQVLADTFGSRWVEGIPVSEVKDAISQAAEFDGALDRLLDPTMESSKLGISEPMAAGAGRIRIDKSTRNLVLIVDVGAGTTDFGLFLVNFEKQTAIPVEPKSEALKRAGNTVDNLLVEHILAKVEGYPDSREKERISSGLRRAGLRRYKETLFNSGSLEVTLATHQDVKVSRDEFLQSEAVVRFANDIERTLAAFLEKVDWSFAAAAERPTMLLSGGGASLPFIKDLLKVRWKIAGREVQFRPGNAVPTSISQYDAAFQDEYPQLAVAMGGAIQVIDESQSLSVWYGGEKGPGPLTKYPITGS
jgi:hypothetical protein